MTLELSERCAVTASDGTPLHYEVVGEGEPIVFVHGGFINRVTWKQQREPLAPHFRLILRDLRGHGRTIGRAARLRLRHDRSGRHARRAGRRGHRPRPSRRPLDRRGDRLRLRAEASRARAAHAADRADAQQSAAAGVRGGALWAAFRALEHADRDGPIAYLRASIEPLLGEGWEARLSPKAIARLHAQAPITVAHGRAFQTMAVGDDDLRAFSVPTLFLYADNSLDIEPLISERIGRVRPDLERRMIASATHNIHSDQPEAVNAAICEFLGACRD